MAGRGSGESAEIKGSRVLNQDERERYHGFSLVLPSNIGNTVMGHVLGLCDERGRHEGASAELLLFLPLAPSHIRGHDDDLRDQIRDCGHTGYDGEARDRRLGARDEMALF